ncbi:MAG TPA: aminotransferase class V-fold PLP-dependent enzyme [Conexibacter sp.]|nr:aminotransferase class V-fold PLP-dependent enzyme [Conexibacter sp.]
MDDVRERLLLGAGPSPVPAPVLAALGRPTIGHLDPLFIALMDETAERLRTLFGTANPVTLPLSATGSGGMEAMVANFVAPGQRVIVGVAGAFGGRFADAAGRRGAVVERVEAPWGEAIPYERLAEAAREPFAALFVVHGETSTGVCQPLDGLAELCRAHDALLLVDCVTSLGGQPLSIDASGVDVAFSGTQKCINCPPGLAPFTAGPRALERIAQPCPSWYFDLGAVRAYWDAGASGRAYHHTAPINMVYALHAALGLLLEEGLEARWARHATAHAALDAALATLGCRRLAREGEQLHPLLAVEPPAGVEEAAVRGALLREHDIEISGGLGPLAGRLWRFGAMGAGATPEVQERLVRALCAVLGADAQEPLAALRAGWRLAPVAS